MFHSDISFRSYYDISRRLKKKKKQEMYMYVIVSRSHDTLMNSGILLDVILYDKLKCSRHWWLVPSIPYTDICTSIQNCITKQDHLSIKHILFFFHSIKQLSKSISIDNIDSKKAK